MGRDGGDFLGVGTNHSAVQLWDASKLRQVGELLRSEIGFYFEKRVVHSETGTLPPA